MGAERERAARLAALAAACVTAACTSTATTSTIQSAEAAAGARSFAIEPRIEAPPVEKTAASPGPPAVEEAALEQPVDLPGLEAAAVARQPGLVAASHRVRAIAERARAEGRLPPPELMAEIWQVPFAKPYALDKASMIMFSIRQQFPAAGALDGMAEATAHEAEAEVARARAEARALVREVDRTFADYAEATARYGAHDAHCAVVEQMVAAARARYTTGGPLGDFTRAELERARTEAERERERGMVEGARVRLDGLLARPADAKLGPPVWAEARTAGITAQQAAAIAASGSPDVAMAERTEEAARAAARAADREATVPAFSVGLDGFLPVNGTPAGYGVSFAMSLPWAWGAGSARARGAEQKALADHAAVEGARIRVRSDAATALTAVRSAERRYVMLRDTAVPAARRAVDATRAGYAAGGAELLTWLDASRTALEVDLDLAAAHADLDRALADLDWAAGGHVPRAALSASKEADHGAH